MINKKIFLVILVLDNSIKTQKPQNEASDTEERTSEKSNNTRTTLAIEKKKKGCCYWNTQNNTLENRDWKDWVCSD
jgi:hypothetical protein